MVHRKDGKALLRALAVAAFAFAPVACEKKLGAPDDGPLTFEVTVANGDLGQESAPIPFSRDEIAMSFDVRAVDRNGEPATWFEGPLHLRVAPHGKLADGQADTFSMSNGVAEGISVRLVDAHNRVHVWVENAGTEEAPENLATGLSPTIYVADPTIRNVQEVAPSTTLPTWETSGIKSDFVEIDLAERSVVVTGVFNDGFYATDLSEPGYAYSSIFVYNYSRPDAAVGDRVVALSGTVDEFFGFTELSFPSFRIEGTVTAPAPVLIDSTNVDDNNVLETYESALVEVLDAVVCPVGDDYATFGQWTVLVDSAATCGGSTGRITVMSADTASDFDPAAQTGKTLSHVRGNLRYHSAADPSWMIYVRSLDDIAVAP